MRVLVVGSDPASTKLIDAALEPEGVISELIESGADAIDLAKHYDFDAVILEMQLPDMAGLDVLRQLRGANVHTPVLMVSTIDKVDEKVAALAAGADDYLTKPFYKSELFARIHAIVRRSRGHTESTIKTGKLVVNLEKRSVDVNGQNLHVTGKEYSILELLSLRKGTTLTKEMFMDHLYGGINEPEPKLIDIFIMKLRKKIVAATGGQHYIETVWGRGYVLRDPGVDATEASNLDHGSLEEQETSLNRLINEMKNVIDSSLLKGIPESVLPKHVNVHIREIRNQIILTDLMFESNRFKKDNQNLIEQQLSIFDEQIIRLQSFHHQCIVRLYSIADRRLEAVEIVDGNVIRISATYDRPISGEHAVRTTEWISEEEFQNDAFTMMADYAKCMQRSNNLNERALCRMAFALEIAKSLASILSQLIPFARPK